MQDWYVLYTKPRSEAQVGARLDADGIESYFPVMPVAAPRRGRSRVRPFFPCYLFAHFDLDAVGVSHINWMPGMRHLVTFGGIPAHVDGAVIARIRQHLDRALVMDVQGEILEHGDRVVITAGAFQDIEAVFDRRLSATGRVRVLVEFLRRTTVVEIEAGALKKLGGSVVR
ncbi:MAG: hypothetical protein HY782_08755 [Chloroflexi bacterium]|nr:hypothetical protein [Chloroflexota bacterium]